MKTLLIVAAATLMSSSAFAQMAPVVTGNYSASVEDSLNRNEDNGQFRFGFSSEASARSTADRDTDGAWFGNFGDYSANVTAEAFHR
jgi:hypothetical protein